LEEEEIVSDNPATMEAEEPISNPMGVVEQSPAMLKEEEAISDVMEEQSLGPIESVEIGEDENSASMDKDDSEINPIDNVGSSDENEVERFLQTCTEPTQTRSGRVSKPAERLEVALTSDKSYMKSNSQVFLASLFQVLSNTIEEEKNQAPKTIRDILVRNDREEWLSSMEKEWNALMENDTFKFVPSKEVSQQRIPVKWVYAIKSSGRKKSRLVVRGDVQKRQKDMDSEYPSPASNLSIMRVVMTWARKNKMKIWSFDVPTAFVKSDLRTEVDGEIYMQMPMGINKRKLMWEELRQLAGVKDLSCKHVRKVLKKSQDEVIKLNKSLYGLCQAALRWYETMKEALLAYGFVMSKLDSCTFYKSDEHVLVLHVDDSLVASKNESLFKAMREHFVDMWKVTVQELPFEHVGMHLKESEEGLHITQDKYLDKLLGVFLSNKDYRKRTRGKSVVTPMEPNKYLTVAADDEVAKLPFRELTGSLQYLARISRPDIQYAVNTLSSFNNKHAKRHYEAGLRILEYVSNTRNMHLCMGTRVEEAKEAELKVYVDADYASDVNDRKSVTGMIAFWYGSPIEWCSTKQKCITKSSTEAEYIAASVVANKAKFLSMFIEELTTVNHGVDMDNISPFRLFIDNQPAIDTIENSNMVNSRLKHVDVSYKHVQELNQAGILRVEHVSTDQNIADAMTKPLGRTKFEQFRSEYIYS